ncbi:MAG: DUF1697 domain-containing protein [Planctomycetes bacterium]|nr:DUF1697 domain-containing protein [Planctomycetota bacterium]
MKRYVALLRGINVGAAGKGRKAVPMARLRELVEGCGGADVMTYIQSGNVVFAVDGAPAKLEAALENAIRDEFGFDVPVVVRPHAELVRIADCCPFAEAAAERPNLVHVGFAKGKVTAAMAKATAPYCTAGERVVVVGQAIWADYAEGVARSKLTPAVLDRAFGASVTMRNVKTLGALVTM